MLELHLIVFQCVFRYLTEHGKLPKFKELKKGEKILYADSFNFNEILQAENILLL